MCTNTYYPICGATLQYDYHDRCPYTPKRPWFGEARAIIEDDGFTSITGVGILYQRHILSAPLDPTMSYLDDTTLESIRLFRPAETRWGYAFYESCWKLLLTRLSLSGIHDQVGIASSVVKLLQATPCPDFCYFHFGHDYGGAAATHKVVGRPDVDLSSPLYANPLEIPSLDELEISTPECLFVLSFGQELSVSGSMNRIESGFRRLWDKLPLEIIHKILPYLSLAQIAALRLTCLDMACLGEWASLPPSFWKSRFMLGQTLFCFSRPGHQEKLVTAFLRRSAILGVSE